MASKQKSGGIGETIRTILWALVIAGVFRTLFFQPFYIPSGSMKDTLLIGDFLFVNKMAYGYSRHSCPFSSCPIPGRILASEPERGDVVVFRHPTRGVDFIKRVIGLPGDSVQMKNGQLWLNGAPVPTTPNGTFDEVKELRGTPPSVPKCSNEPVGIGGLCQKERYTETLPHKDGSTVSYDVLSSDPNWGVDNTPVFVVPEGKYFFMGDNRDNSQDSRFPQTSGGVGYVDAEYLIGRADRIMFSSAGKSLLFFWTWRPDRFFKAIQ